MLFTLAFTVAGCGTTHRDLTMTPDVQQSGVLGLHLRTSRDLVLVNNKRSRTFLLETKDCQPDPDSPKIGVVAAGTTLQINRVIHVTEPAGWPFYLVWNCTQARIEDGHYAGEEIAIAGEGPALFYDLDRREIALLGTSLLRPVNQASMISALYHVGSYSCGPPPPAKYDLYDSRSNQFATVTLIRPVPWSTEKFDGLWIGSLDKSYVRPKSKFVLASDKFNVRDLHPLTGGWDHESRQTADKIYLYPDEPNDQILLFLPRPETSGPVNGDWVYYTDGGEVEHGTFAGPVR